MSPLQIIPVLRAGLVLLEQAQQVIPVSVTYHVGYVRDEETLKVRGRGGEDESVGEACGEEVWGRHCSAPILCLFPPPLSPSLSFRRGCT